MFRRADSTGMVLMNRDSGALGSDRMLKKAAGLENPKAQSLFLPALTVFMASFCLMVIELTAARIVARYLGTSIYTWTSVIGVVLAGIATGNYAGGYAADRFSSTRCLSIVFTAASVACAAIPLMNRLMGDVMPVWVVSTLWKSTIHVAFVFFVPAAILGVVAPTVTKFALHRGLSEGRTVGSMFAWGTAGSIVGTFLAGFFLIPNLSVSVILFAISGLLAIAGFWYGLIAFKGKGRVLAAWPSVIFIMAILNTTDVSWAKAISENLALREPVNSRMIYQDESFYGSIAVMQAENDANIRELLLDRLAHNIVDISNPADAEAFSQYTYMRLYAAITRYLGSEKKDLSALVIGGGGYVMPRFLRKEWPGSQVTVVEIDPAVTAAAEKALGLTRDNAVSIQHLDARNFVDKTDRTYDFVYGDALNDLSIPFQLTTHEFNESLKKVLAPEGVYMTHVIDNNDTRYFLSAMVATLKETFSYVTVFTNSDIENREHKRNTFIVTASMKAFDFGVFSFENFQECRLIPETELNQALAQNTPMLLTDDFAPVDRLLLPAYAQREVETASLKLTERGDKAAKHGDLGSASKLYEEALRLEARLAKPHNNLAGVLARQGKIEEAKKQYEKALSLDPKFAVAHTNLAILFLRESDKDAAIYHFERAITMDPQFAEAEYNLATLYLNTGDPEKARQHYQAAVAKKDKFYEAHLGLGNVLNSLGRYDEAVHEFRIATQINPMSAQAYNNLGAILEEHGDLSGAAMHYVKALSIDPNYQLAKDNLDAVVRMQSRIQGQKGNES